MVEFTRPPHLTVPPETNCRFRNDWTHAVRVELRTSDGTCAEFWLGLGQVLLVTTGPHEAHLDLPASDPAGLRLIE